MNMYMYILAKDWGEDPYKQTKWLQDFGLTELQ